MIHTNTHIHRHAYVYIYKDSIMSPITVCKRRQKTEENGNIMEGFNLFKVHYMHV
jgi:hypothetical protein